MLHRFRDVGHLRNECNPVGECCEVIGLHQRVAFTRPTWQRAEAALNFDVGKGWHCS